MFCLERLRSSGSHSRLSRLSQLVPGLNLTAADHVLLIDPFGDPAPYQTWRHKKAEVTPFEITQLGSL